MMARMRSVLLLAAVLSALPLAARADIIDLSATEGRRNTRIPTLAIRGEAGTDFAPYGLAGACLSWFNELPFGGFEIEGGAGATFPGLQLGLAVRNLLGENGDYFVFELAISGNTTQKRGADPSVNRLTSANSWSSLGLGFEHRQGYVTFGIVASLAFLTNFDLVPHGVVHGGIGFAF
jgi:hypothetical protein